MVSLHAIVILRNVSWLVVLEKVSNIDNAQTSCLMITLIEKSTQFLINFQSALIEIQKHKNEAENETFQGCYQTSIGWKEVLECKNGLRQRLTKWKEIKLL